MKPFIIVILTYSAIKIRENRPATYSTWKVYTSFDSPVKSKWGSVDFCYSRGKYKKNLARVWEGKINHRYSCLITEYK